MAKPNNKEKVTPEVNKEEVTEVANETVESKEEPTVEEVSKNTESDEVFETFEDEVPLEGIDRPGFINRADTLWIPPVLRD